MKVITFIMLYLLIFTFGVTTLHYIEEPTTIPRWLILIGGAMLATSVLVTMILSWLHGEPHQHD